MPAAFAHMVAADKAKRQLEKQGLKILKIALNKYPQWLQAGTVGPDYPYLDHMLTSHDESDSWADLFHYVKTGDVVRSGVNILRTQYLSQRDDEAFKKALAWLYGYTAHVVLDASIHPVVRAIVGEYDQNKTKHRACEMCMDSFIYYDYFKIELDNSNWVDYLKDIADSDTGGMDSSIASLWHAMLKDVYPSDYAKNPPQIDRWQKVYGEKLSLAQRNAVFFRHVAAEKGIFYALSTKISPKDRTKYIEKALLPKPNKFSQETMHYKKIFEFGVENVARIWIDITAAIKGDGDPTIPGLLNWNLDKGTIDPVGIGDATLWI